MTTSNWRSSDFLENHFRLVDDVSAGAAGHFLVEKLSGARKTYELRHYEIAINEREAATYFGVTSPTSGPTPLQQQQQSTRSGTTVAEPTFIITPSVSIRRLARHQSSPSTSRMLVSSSRLEVRPSPSGAQLLFDMVMPHHALLKKLEIHFRREAEGGNGPTSSMYPSSSPMAQRPQSAEGLSNNAAQARCPVQRIMDVWCCWERRLTMVEEEVVVEVEEEDDVIVGEEASSEEPVAPALTKKTILVTKEVLSYVATVNIILEHVPYTVSSLQQLRSKLYELSEAYRQDRRADAEDTYNDRDMDDVEAAGSSSSSPLKPILWAPKEIRSLITTCTQVVVAANSTSVSGDDSGMITPYMSPRPPSSPLAAGSARLQRGPLQPPSSEEDPPGTVVVGLSTNTVGCFLAREGAFLAAHFIITADAFEQASMPSPVAKGRRRKSNMPGPLGSNKSSPSYSAIAAVQSCTARYEPSVWSHVFEIDKYSIHHRSKKGAAKDDTVCAAPHVAPPAPSPTSVSMFLLGILVMDIIRQVPARQVTGSDLEAVLGPMVGAISNDVAVEAQQAQPADAQATRPQPSLFGVAFEGDPLSLFHFDGDASSPGDDSMLPDREVAILEALRERALMAANVDIGGDEPMQICDRTQPEPQRPPLQLQGHLHPALPRSNEGNGPPLENTPLSTTSGSGGGSGGVGVGGVRFSPFTPMSTASTTRTGNHNQSPVANADSLTNPATANSYGSPTTNATPNSFAAIVAPQPQHSSHPRLFELALASSGMAPQSFSAMGTTPSTSVLPSSHSQPMMPYHTTGIVTSAQNGSVTAMRGSTADANALLSPGASLAGFIEPPEGAESTPATTVAAVIPQNLMTSSFRPGMAPLRVTASAPPAPNSNSDNSTLLVSEAPAPAVVGRYDGSPLANSSPSPRNGSGSPSSPLSQQAVGRGLSMATSAQQHQPSQRPNSTNSWLGSMAETTGSLGGNSVLGNSGGLAPATMRDRDVGTVSDSFVSAHQFNRQMVGHLPNHLARGSTSASIATAPQSSIYTSATTFIPHNTLAHIAGIGMNSINQLGSVAEASQSAYPPSGSLIGYAGQSVDADSWAALSLPSALVSPQGVGTSTHAHNNTSVFTARQSSSVPPSMAASSPSPVAGDRAEEGSRPSVTSSTEQPVMASSAAPTVAPQRSQDIFADSNNQADAMQLVERTSSSPPAISISTTAPHIARVVRASDPNSPSSPIVSIAPVQEDTSPSMPRVEVTGTPLPAPTPPLLSSSTNTAAPPVEGNVMSSSANPPPPSQEGGRRVTISDSNYPSQPSALVTSASGGQGTHFMMSMIDRRLEAAGKALAATIEGRDTSVRRPHTADGHGQWGWGGVSGRTEEDSRPPTAPSMVSGGDPSVFTPQRVKPGAAQSVMLLPSPPSRSSSALLTGLKAIHASRTAPPSTRDVLDFLKSLLGVLLLRPSVLSSGNPDNFPQASSASRVGPAAQRQHVGTGDALPSLCSTPSHLLDVLRSRNMAVALNTLLTTYTYLYTNVKARPATAPNHSFNDTLPALTNTSMALSPTAPLTPHHASRAMLLSSGRHMAHTSTSHGSGPSPTLNRSPLVSPREEICPRCDSRYPELYAGVVNHVAPPPQKPRKLGRDWTQYLKTIPFEVQRAAAIEGTLMAAAHTTLTSRPATADTAMKSRPAKGATTATPRVANAQKDFSAPPTPESTGLPIRPSTVDAARSSRPPLPYHTMPAPYSSPRPLTSTNIASGIAPYRPRPHTSAGATQRHTSPLPAVVQR